MQPAKCEKHNRKKKCNSMVWLSAVLLAILVTATVSIAGSCLYGYAHQSDCQISLYDGQIKDDSGVRTNAASQKKAASDAVAKSTAVHYTGSAAKQQSAKSGLEVDDATQVWKTETAIELFKTEYKNADGVVSVKSADGKKVIAPGTEGSYTFTLNNEGDSSADYKIWVEAQIESKTKAAAPIQMRMSGNSGWLLGTKNTWADAKKLDGVETEETIPAGKSAEYTIFWQWPFEQGKDVSDTGLGNLSVDQETSYTVTIYTLTASAPDANPSDAHHKKINFRHAVKTGDNPFVFAWAGVLIVSASILLILCIWKKRKNDEEDEQNESGQKS